MIIPQKYFAVNWTESMKVNAEHLAEHENYFTDQLRDIVSVNINRYNFGLLSPLPGGGARLSDYEMTKTATDQLQIRINQCEAITPGGVRISISGEGFTKYIPLSKLLIQKDENNTGSTFSASEIFYLVLTVNPFNRTPSGIPNPEETPIRQPFNQPTYDVELINTKQINEQESGAYYLVIGRIIQQGDHFQKDMDFIAPCSSLVSEEKLQQYYKSICKSMEDLQACSLQIVQKINFKNQKSTVAQNSKAACISILDYMAHHYFYFRNMIHQQPPVCMIDAISSFAGILNTFFQVLPENEKEELLNYFHEWSDITQVTFMSKMADVIEINYNHYQVGTYMKMITQMLDNIVLIWKKLSTLEFIGQHKENIVVKEEVISQVVKEKKGWSILD